MFRIWLLQAELLIASIQAHIARILSMFFDIGTIKCIAPPIRPFFLLFYLVGVQRALFILMCFHL